MAELGMLVDIQQRVYSKESTACHGVGQGKFAGYATNKNKPHRELVMTEKLP